MTNLERKKVELEYQRVKTARMDLEFKIEERKEEIDRLLKHVEIQKAKEAELEQELK